jgi:hypothetical protein
MFTDTSPRSRTQILAFSGLGYDNMSGAEGHDKDTVGTILRGNVTRLPSDNGTRADNSLAMA